MKLYIGGAMLVVTIMLGAIYLLAEVRPTPVHVHDDYTCHTFDVTSFNAARGLMVIGDMSLCGYAQEWTRIEGPRDGVPPDAYRDPRGPTQKSTQQRKDGT